LLAADACPGLVHCGECEGCTHVKIFESILPFLYQERWSVLARIL
jgi:hypothetical protein